MNAPTRLAVFASGLAVVFGLAFGAGRLVGPDAVAGSRPAADGHAGGGGGHGTTSGPQTGAYAIRVEPYTGETLRFRITGSGGTVTAFDTLHEKPLHLIVVRRDLSGFQHLHPVMDATGTWSVPLALADGGPWRAYADFTATGGPATVLAADLTVPGEHQTRPLPAPATTSVVDGYTVRLDLHDGVTFRVERDGRPVTDLQPYLGAPGHLVAIAQEDLTYLHVHPTGEGLAFAVEGAGPGVHRLYLQFQHGGAVHTAEFTVTGIGGGHAHN